MGGILVTASAPTDFLRQIHATDEDGLHAGRVTFNVQGNGKTVGIFMSLFSKCFMQRVSSRDIRAPYMRPVNARKPPPFHRGNNCDLRRGI